MREDRATTGYYCHRHEKNVRNYFCYDCEAEEINPSKYVKINDMEKEELMTPTPEERINNIAPHDAADAFAYAVKASQHQKIIDRLGPYRPPTDVTIPKFKKLQEKCLELGLLIHEECPDSPEKSTAITLLTQVKMMANAAVAIYTPPVKITESDYKVPSP